MTTAMKWVYKILFGFIFICVIGFTGFYLFIENIPYSEGTRTGKIVKISKKGVIFKTWEGELNQGMGMPEKFSFSVSDPEVIKKIQEFEGKDNVKLSYEERYTKFFWEGDSKYYIVDCLPK